MAGCGRETKLEHVIVVCTAVLCLTPACGGSGPSSPSGVIGPGADGGRLTMSFTPENASFTEATDEYRRLWADEGARIVEAMERLTGLTFFQFQITAIVYEGISSSGDRDTPMRLRASYDADTKRATLVHELGHRLISQLTRRPPDLDEHRVLYLFLFEVWESLWGTEFAERQVLVESARRGVYDYESAWMWARSLTSEQRAARFSEIMRSNGR